MRFHALVDAMFEGIVIQEEGKIIEANPGYARMFGYSLEIYVVDGQGKKVNNSEIPITYDGYKALLQILEAHLVDLGIKQRTKT